MTPADLNVEPIVTPTVKRLCVILLKGPLSQGDCGYALFRGPTKESGFFKGPRSPQGAALAASKHTRQARDAGLVYRCLDGSWRFDLTAAGKQWAEKWRADAERVEREDRINKAADERWKDSVKATP